MQVFALDAPLPNSTSAAVASAYDAVAPSDMAMLFMGTNIVGVVLYLLILLSYLYVPIIKAQHPAADIVIWQVVAGLMTCIGFIVSYANALPDPHDPSRVFPWPTCALLGVYNQFWVLSGCLWYLMLAVDLLVALVNPWMGYACKAGAYHITVWSLSFVSAVVVYQQHAAGLCSLNFCWITRTADPQHANRLHWIVLFVPVLATFLLSLAVQLFASFRFVRRQLDVTYRSKRRILMQYYRYLLIFGAYWTACGALYYADYRQGFTGAMATRIQLAWAVVFGAYPLLLLVVWVLNTELYQHRSNGNSLSSAERDTEPLAGKTEHFSAALRKDLMRYTTAGIRCSINEELFGGGGGGASAVDAMGSTGPPGTLSPPLHRTRLDSIGSSVGYFSSDELGIGSGGGGGAGGGGGGPPELYSEKKRRATTVFNGEYRFYEKLGFTDYAPKIFENIRAACGIDNSQYEKSFAGTLLERASEGKSGMLFYFTSDRKYLVKTMTKKEHSFLLEILPLYHQYILRQPNTLLCRFLGCHSMQLPVGWNKMFFLVMENVFADGPVDERYDLKGIFHQTTVTTAGESSLGGRRRHRGNDAAAYDAQDTVLLDIGDDGDHDESFEDEDATTVSVSDRLGDDDHSRSSRPEMQPLLVRRVTSRSSLRHDSDFVCRRASLRVNATTRANLLAQITNDCGFLQELGIMDYSFLLGVKSHGTRVDVATLEQLAHNAVVSDDQTKIYYLGYVDILQHYNFGWKLQHWFLSTILDKRTITALPPAEYGLRFLGFIHAYMLCDTEMNKTRSYGSVDMTAFQQ